jgi:prepilin-type N-terminal cleavage/methylation domain-containing protein
VTNRQKGEDGVTLIEVLVAIVLILGVSLLATTSITSSLNEGEVATQRLQAARILATLLSTGGCGSTSTVSDLGTTFSASVSPNTCSGGVTDTGTVNWTTSATSYQIVITSISPPSSGISSAYAVTT